MVVFLSVPMIGRSDEEIKDQLSALEVAVREQLCSYASIPNSFSESDPPFACKNAGLWYLSQSLDTLSKCDTIVMAPEWDKYRGCTFEHEAAKSYGLDVVYTRYSDEAGHRIVLDKGDTPDQSNFDPATAIPFTDVPVGAVYVTQNGMKFKKTRDVMPIDYSVSIEKRIPNCVDLANNHKCSAGLHIMCCVMNDN